MDPFTIILILVLLLLNLSAFTVMAVDKAKASIPEARRVSEGMLFFLAAAFGALGVYGGMFAFRHKTRKWHFLIGIPLLIVQNLATAFLLYLFLSGRI